MKKLFYIFVAVVSVFIGFASFASAISIFDITYPIAELNGCASQAECKVYCDDSDHKDACLNFAEKYGLVSKEKVEEAKKLPKIGPGGCQGEKECRAYCDNIDHENECLAFTSKHGMKINDPRGAAVSARARLIKERGGPGNCQSQKECLAYCDDQENAEECLNFAEKNNMMSKEDIERARKMTGKPGPGGCRGQEECRAFCDNPDNKDACFQFAVDNELIPEKEMNRVAKMKQVMQNGPGGCKGEKECRAYCDNADHFEECGEFAGKNGLIDEKEIKMMERGRELGKKVMELGGPGGCKNDAECHAYCGKPDNVEECLAFAVKHGGVEKEEALDMLEGFTQADARNKQDQFRRNEIGKRQLMPVDGFAQPSIRFATSSEEDHFGKFERFIELEGQFRKSPEMMRNFQGPGGCGGPEECIKYCSDSAHREECAKLNPSVGGLPPGDVFRQTEPGAEREFRRIESVDGNKIEDLARCGPRPAMPTPQGCAGPVCKDGRWDFKCEDFNSREYATSSEMLPPPINIGGERNNVLCAQEYKPVCGANNRTYPNECFAKMDRVVVVKDGRCDISNEGGQPLDNLNSERPSINQYPFQYIKPLIRPEQQRIEPQSKRTTNSFLSNLLQSFSQALKFK